MAQEQQTVDIADIPAVRELAEEVARTRRPKVLRVADEDVAIVMPVASPRRRSPSKARPVTHDDALFRLVGIGRSEKPSNAAEHKHEALEQAYRSHIS